MPGIERHALNKRMKQEDARIWEDWAPFNVRGKVKCSKPRGITWKSRIQAHANHFIDIARMMREEEDRLRGEALVVDDDAEERPFVVDDDDEEETFVMDNDDEGDAFVVDGNDDNEFASSHTDTDSEVLTTNHKGDSSEDEEMTGVKEEARGVKEEEMEDAMSEILEDAMSEILEDVKTENMVALKEEIPGTVKREDSEDDMKPLAHPALRKRKGSSPQILRPRTGRLAGITVIDIDD